MTRIANSTSPSARPTRNRPEIVRDSHGRAFKHYVVTPVDEERIRQAAVKRQRKGERLQQLAARSA